MTVQPIPTLDVRTAAAELEAAASGQAPLLVDVREPGETAVVRVPGSYLLPLTELTARSDELPRGRRLLFMCAAGKRSLVAADYVRRAGHDDVASVDGGIIAWQREGLPTESG